MTEWPKEGIVREEMEGVVLPIYKDRPRSVLELLYRSAASRPEHPALICGRLRWTYQDLETHVNRTARVLKRRWGVCKGDRVAVLLGNCPEFAVLYLAVIAVGAVFVPLNTRLKSRELAFQMEKAAPVLLFFGGAIYKEIEPLKDRLPFVRELIGVGDNSPGTALFDLQAETGSAARLPLKGSSETDLACILFTSGTTGRPKGVMLTHCNVVNTAIACARVFDATADDVDLIMVPLFHVTGLFTQLSQTLFLGGTAVLMRTFKAEDALGVIEKEQVTLSISVPTIYWLMLINPGFSRFRLDTFRKIIYGGAPASPELVQQLSKAFPGASLINAGGLTEGTSLQYALPAKDAIRKAGSVGFPTPCTECRIIGEDGAQVPAGQVGELVLKGAGIAKGYWQDPGNTKKTFRNGWLHTGDLGRVDDDGYLWLMDRKKDMIIRGGENIFSIEIENVLYGFPKTLEAAVVGVPDRIFGEQVKAFVVLKQGETASPEEVQAYCEGRLADYKVPKYIRFLKEPLPRNPGGKVRKEILRAMDGETGNCAMPEFNHHAASR